MKIIKSIGEMVKFRAGIAKDRSVGFVPTMGALHSGHLSLIDRSKRDNSVTIVSIFVNPIQFGPREDFGRYPRPWKEDLAKLEAARIDVLFSPSEKEMYQAQNDCRIQVLSLRDKLCGDGRFRGPEHFDGVATVVAKLFHLTKPNRAYFGLKDYQQIRIIEQMVQDLNFCIEILRCPTIREEDGLAMSSRNCYLSTVERKKAPQLYAALQYGRKLLTSKRKIDGKSVCRVVRRSIMNIPVSKIDYVELVDADTLMPVKNRYRPAVLAAAIHLNRTRLIDNIFINHYEKKILH